MLPAPPAAPVTLARRVWGALFATWGFIGLLGAIFNLLDLWIRRPLNVADTTYIAATALIWIGGMLLFGLLALLSRRPR